MNNFFSGQKILITGAYGFIGFHLAKRLASLPVILFLVDIHPLIDSDSEFREILDPGRVTYFEGNLSDKKFVNSLPESDIVFHLAAVNGTDNFYEIPFDVLLNSSLPTVFLLEKYRECKKFVYAGSSESYAGAVNLGIAPIPTPESVPFVIDEPGNPRWSYSLAKSFGEVACHGAAIQFGTNFTILRFHNIYGPRMGFKHVIPDFLARARRGEYTLFGSEETRSFLYIDDAIEDIIGSTAMASQGTTFNLGGYEEISILNLATLILNILNINQPVIQKFPAPRGSVKRRKPMLDSINNLLGERSRVNLDLGLKTTIDWYLRGKE